MSDERKGLSSSVQLLLAFLALLPAWYFVAGKLWPSTDPEDQTPYYMWCSDCDLHYPCGPNGIPGMRCPHCANAEAILLFRTRTDTDLWDLVVKLFIGVIALLALLVLVVGGHQPRKKTVAVAAETPEKPKTPEADVSELKDWARTFVEDRRRRLQH